MSRTDHTSENHSAKEIKPTKDRGTLVEFNWEKVTKGITSLFLKDRYLTQEQKDAYKRIK